MNKHLSFTQTYLLNLFKEQKQRKQRALQYMSMPKSLMISVKSTGRSLPVLSIWFV